MFLSRLIAKKRNLVLVCCCCIAVYLSLIFIRYIRLSFRGHYLSITLEDGSHVSVYYDERWPTGPDQRKHIQTITLLFVKSMAVQTWEQIGTPDVLQDAGYRVLSVHLPVVSERKSEPTYPITGAILTAVLQRLNALDCVLVAPSKTGAYAMPVVIRGGFQLRGFVAISTSDTHHFTDKEYRLIGIPILIFHGRDDKSPKTEALENLNKFPNKQVVELENAGHFCYVDQLIEFHRILLKFLTSIH